MRNSASRSDLRVGINSQIEAELNKLFHTLCYVETTVMCFRYFMEFETVRGVTTLMDDAVNTPFNVIEREFARGLESECKAQRESLVNFASEHGVPVTLMQDIPKPAVDLVDSGAKRGVRDGLNEVLRVLRGAIDTAIGKCHESNQYSSLRVLNEMAASFSASHKRYMGLFSQ